MVHSAIFFYSIIYLDGIPQNIQSGESMTLQEILKSLNLTEEQIRAVNTAVDTVISSKTLEKDNEIKKLQGDLERIDGELKPFKIQERNNKIKTLLPKDANVDMFDDIIALSKIDETDAEDIISKKLSETIATRDYLKAKAKINDDAGVRVNEKTPNPPKGQSKESSSNLPLDNL